jgi:hypothetical protein
MDQATAFVRMHGDASELERLRHLLTGDPPGLCTLDIFNGQRPDGGFPPPWSPDYSSVDATCFRLAQAEQAGFLPAAPELSGAIGFLVGRQRGDGSWEEYGTQAAVAPPWALPGDLRAQAYLTANAGLWALRAGQRDVGVMAAARLRFLLGTDRAPQAFLHTCWLAASLYWASGDYASAEKMLAYLSMRLQALSASGLAWLVVSLTAAGVPSDHGLIDTGRRTLLQLQRTDGAFPSEDGPAYDVYATLAAMQALRT